MFEPLTSAADPRRTMPEAAGARLDQARAAVASLRSEQRRLSRLGLETPLSRCHDQLRYWQFIAGIVSLDAEAGERS